MQCTPYGPCLALRITEQCCCSALHGVTQQVIRNTSAPGAKGPQTSPGNGRLAIKIITWGLPRGRGPALGCELLSDFGMRLWASCCMRRCWFPLLRHRGIQTPSSLPALQDSGCLEEMLRATFAFLHQVGHFNEKDRINNNESTRMFVFLNQSVACK